MLQERIFWYVPREKKTIVVSLGDGFTSDIMGVGIVKIKIFDEMVCTLNDLTSFKDSKESNITMAVGLHGL